MPAWSPISSGGSGCRRTRPDATLTSSRAASASASRSRAPSRSSPDLVVADEITSGLDVTVKLRVLALLRELQTEFRVAYLFISHDLAVVRQVADRVAVMYLGQIVEEAPTDALFDRPLHPYTRVLQASVPPPDPAVSWRPPVLSGDPPSPLSIPPGCRFHPRCPIAEPRCRVEPPRLRVLGTAHRVACHLAS